MNTFSVEFCLLENIRKIICIFPVLFEQAVLMWERYWDPEQLPLQNKNPDLHRWLAQTCHKLHQSQLFNKHITACRIIFCCCVLLPSTNWALPFCIFWSSCSSLEHSLTILHAPTICEKLCPISFSTIFYLTSIYCWQHVFSLFLLNSFPFI